MQKFVISVKDRNTGRDVFSPYVVSSLEGLGRYCERFCPLGFIVVVDSITENDDFVELESENVCKNACYEK